MFVLRVASHSEAFLGALASNFFHWSAAIPSFDAESYRISPEFLRLVKILPDACAPVGRKIELPG